jgi:hypothetical protein
MNLYLHSPIHLHGLVLNLLTTGTNFPLCYLSQFSSTFKHAKMASFWFAYSVHHNCLLNVNLQFMLKSSKQFSLYSWHLFSRSRNSVLPNLQYHHHQNESALGPYPETMPSSSQLHNLYLRSILIQTSNIQIHYQSGIFFKIRNQVWYVFVVSPRYDTCSAIAVSEYHKQSACKDVK